MKSDILHISIIVPVLNDAVELAGLLANLTAQAGIDFELILCDGGSGVETARLVAEWTVSAPFPLHLLTTPRGRGAQMNAGAAIAAADTLLFLHADSRFADPNALSLGFAAFRDHATATTTIRAARFGLRFRRETETPSLAYFYHEAKARLNRSDCIRGDQGFMIERRSFNQLGRFDTSLPYLEDVRLATRLAGAGEWLLLPAEIFTSARRFEQEGFYERQVANVIIVNAMETGWDELLQALPGLYRDSIDHGRLRLFPLLDNVRRMIAAHDPAWQRRFWRATGYHVAANAWQLFFWLDVRAAWHTGLGPDHVQPDWLGRYQRHLVNMMASRPAARLAELLTRLWFWWLRRKTGP